MSEQMPELPQVEDVLLSTAVSLVNLAGIRLTEADHKDVVQAREAIDAARALLPLCPEEGIGPVKDALSQLQMLYVKEEQSRAHSAEPSASGKGDRPQEAGAGAPEADERAQARSKIWTPPGS